MLTKIHAYLFDSPKENRSSAYRYGMLLIFFSLVAWNVSRAWNAYHDAILARANLNGWHMNVVITTLLLINHLAFEFRFPPRITCILRIIAAVWLVFTLVYTFQVLVKNSA